MWALFMMVCVFGLTMGMAFAEGESLTNADGSFCEEGGKAPASVSSVREETESSAGSIQE